VELSVDAEFVGLTEDDLNGHALNELGEPFEPLHVIPRVKIARKVKISENITAKYCVRRFYGDID